MARKHKKMDHRSANAGGQAFPVVGIGASAGGVEAVGKFFGAMPAECPMAFVVVLHLDPTHESQLASIIACSTALPVTELRERTKIKPGHVYVIAPDSYVTVESGEIHLSAPSQPRGHRFPVDVLFASLADELQEQSICVVLSGTGRNGTEGLKKVKGVGGCTIVQAPETAKFDGMPRSAITAGVADQVLAPEKMPDFLLRYFQHGYFAAPEVSKKESETADPTSLARILSLVRSGAGADFRGYKRGTLERRIHRRMGINAIESFDEYGNFLRKNQGEVNALAKDLIISVTSFFRDADAWQTVVEAVLEPLSAEREADAEVRFWVPACATGEEAYTLAMLMMSRCEAAAKPINLKIFATDSQEDNLHVAREGIYPPASVSNIPPDLLSRFFEKLDDAYQAKAELRELVVFARHNLLRDPPFSRLDLVSCRNLLIYLEPDLQRKVIALLHFAVREGGHLLLGNVESVGQLDELFEPVSKKWRLYRRLGPTRHNIVDFPLLGGSSRPEHSTVASPPVLAPASQSSAAELTRRTLLDRYTPAAVLIDHRSRVLYFHGPTGDYLQPPSGEPTRDLLAMARDGLRAQLRGAVRQAIESDENVAYSGRVRDGGVSRPVRVTVSPVKSDEARNTLLVSFETDVENLSPLGLQQSTPGTSPIETDRDKKANSSLEEELKAARSELRNTIQEMERSNEELKAANEEVTSMNEELQSTNEELETSKEELQSFNEELHTINNQLHHKLQELENITNDQKNLLSGTDVATVFLDENLNIKWYSPASKDLLDLVPSDLGRPIRSFAWKVEDPAILRDAEKVLETLAPIQAEVSSQSGQWYQRRTLPYRTQDNRISGVVVTFVDITERKRATEEIDEARIFSEAIVATLRQPLLVLDHDLRVRAASPVFYKFFHATPEDTVGRHVYDLGNGQWDIPKLRELLEDILPHDQEVDDFVVEHTFADLGPRTMVLNARRLQRNGGRPGMILVSIEDVTRQQAADVHRDFLIAELNHRVKNTLATVQSLASQTIRRSSSLKAFKVAFYGRIEALAHTHDLLAERNWESIQLDELARRIIEPYAEGEQISCNGPPIGLNARSATALVLILHELVTNAAKYGALSTPSGRLDIAWSLNHELQEVVLCWEERGGPPVKPPEKQGFGTIMIQRSAAYELKGKAKLEYRPEGVVCELVFPVGELRSDTSTEA